MYNNNRRGPSKAPCGTPNVTELNSESSLLSVTICEHLHKYDLKNDCEVLSKPNKCHVVQRSK